MKLKKFNELNDWMDPYNRKRMGEADEDDLDFEDKLYGEGYINPVLFTHEDELSIITEKLEFISSEMEKDGPVDGNLLNAIEALNIILDKIKSANK